MKTWGRPINLADNENFPFSTVLSVKLNAHVRHEPHELKLEAILECVFFYCVSEFFELTEGNASAKVLDLSFKFVALFLHIVRLVKNSREWKIEKHEKKMNYDIFYFLMF